jgi:hypothetical protein
MGSRKVVYQIFIPTACTKIKDENLVWSDFEDNSISIQMLRKQYAQVTYPKLTEFL